MAYSNNNDLLMELSFQELARLSGDELGKSINEERIAHARDSADALIDSYLYGRYCIPFEDNIEPIIKKLSIDLTICNLYEYMNHNSILPNTISQKKDNAFSILNKLQTANIAINQDTYLNNNLQPIIINKNVKDTIFNKNILDSFFCD